ncbi:MAG TPA: hypothetical protein VMV44_13690 [Rectinemataceae bacterium]|nr:hypothetical protein [Rectinemataceae bacterium]
MASRNGNAIAENDRRLIKDHASYVREALFSCVTQTQVECSVAFARYLSLAGLNAENYWLFLRLVMTNNPWVIDEMLHDREPRLLFSTIRPDTELIEAAFQTLFSRHPEELYPRALEALLGIIQSAYFDADDGFRIRKLSIMDINALGKFLLKDQPQEHPQNRLILEILDRITRLGDYYGEPDKSVLSKHAFNVRFAYFDRTREMIDAIPEPLLVRVADRNGVAPEEDYADLVAKRRERKRDRSGRFIKEFTGNASSDGASIFKEASPASRVSSADTGADGARTGLTPQAKMAAGETTGATTGSKDVGAKALTAKPASKKPSPAVVHSPKAPAPKAKPPSGKGKPPAGKAKRH